MTVSLSGETVALGPHLRRLLALFAVNVGTVVSSDAISEALWPGEVKDPQGRAVRTYVARLRRAPGDAGEPIISTQAPGYMLRVGPETRLDSQPDFMLPRSLDWSGWWRSIRCATP